MSPANMTLEQIRAAVLKAHEDFNMRNLAAYNEHFCPNLVVHNLATGLEINGMDAQKQALNEILISFPDLHRTIEDIIVEGDIVATRYTQTGTHQGKLGARSGNLSPTGKRVTQTVFNIQRYEGGKVAELWAMSNRLDFYQQLGVTPTPDMK